MRFLGILTVLALIVLPLVAQDQSGPGAPESYLVAKSIRAVSYQVGGGSSKLDLRPTGLISSAGGEASVESKKGGTNVEVSVVGLTDPQKLGPQFLTYVVWAVSPDGRAVNLGEIQLDNGKGKLKAITPLQTFSLFVTAEPYFAVRHPSEMLVLENELRKGMKGKVVILDSYKVLRKATYETPGNPIGMTLDLKKVPLEMYEARNAVEIAKQKGADKYAPEIYPKAEAGLKIAENELIRKNKKEVLTRARMTIQSAEDARAFAVVKQEEERIENEKAAAAAKAKADAEAKAAAEAAEAKRQADLAAAEAKRKADAEAAEIRRRAEEDQKHQAELAAAREAQMKAEADAAAMKAKAEQDALKAKEEAANAEAERARAAAQALRAQLLEQFNRILETKDTPRGLVVTMADVLFDVGKYDLRPTTREKLARLAGIMLAHQGLQLQIEGHTDSTGSDELNQKLSEQRAGTVKSFLVEQGLNDGAVSAQGFGKTMPVADNTTAKGRQQNRRVEIIVSGEVIGVKLGS